MQRTDIVGERYVLRDSLGRGGMGEVYLARDELLGRDVAVKLLKAQHAENPQFVERFRREAKNAAALSHQNIVSVYDAGESPDGTPYMAMEYVGGGTLAERIETEQTDSINPLVMRAAPMAGRCSTHSLNSLG